jgi:hypothetical protein
MMTWQTENLGHSRRDAGFAMPMPFSTCKSIIWHDEGFPGT